jgi:hypothetical protein
LVGKLNTLVFSIIMERYVVFPVILLLLWYLPLSWSSFVYLLICGIYSFLYFPHWIYFPLLCSYALLNMFHVLVWQWWIPSVSVYRRRFYFSSYKGQPCEYTSLGEQLFSLRTWNTSFHLPLTCRASFEKSAAFYVICYFSLAAFNLLYFFFHY